MKIETGEQGSKWHEYVNIGLLNYNTFYQASIGCEPSRVLQGRIAYNVFGLKKSFRLKVKTTTSNSQFAQDVLERTERIF